MGKKYTVFWIIVFVIIFLLSQDHLFVSWKGDTGILGLPSWLAWFVFVHVLFIAALYWFSKKHWR